MNVNNVVRTITIRGASEGIEKLTADLGRLAGAQENVAIVSESSARRTLSIADAWKKQTLALDDAARSSSRAAAATKVAGNALSEGLISTQQYADRLDLIAQKYGVVTAAAEKFNRAQSLSNVNSAQAVNQRLGVKDDFNTGVRANDVAAYGRQLDDVRAKFNPLFAAGRQYKDTLTEINTAAKTGAISEKERAEAITRTKAIFVEQVDVINRSSSAIGQNTKAIGLNRYELLNLSRQSQDVVVSLAGGQSPFVVLTQQGSQILDVFQAANGSVRGFFSQAIGWAGRFAASTAGVVTGIAALGAGVLYMAGTWTEAQREIDKALIGLGRRSGVTAKDINEIARTSATATGLSVDEARGAALEFAKTGAIYKDNIMAAVAVTHDFAIVTGKDAKDAAKDLGAALASPLEGADALNSKLGFLDGRTREYIATLVSQNQKQEAQAVLLRNLAPAIQEATNTLGPFERAWNAVANAASAAKNAIGSALTPRTTEEQRDALITSINQRTGSSVDAPPALAAQASRFNSGEVSRMKDEVEKLNESLRETARARALAFESAKKLSLDTDDAVRQLIPYIDQLKKVEELLNRIRAAENNQGVTDRQGLAGANAEAARAAQVLALNIKNTREETDRANIVALELTQQYGTASIEVAKTRAALADQLMVAGAIGGQARMAAQERATYNDLIRQGKTEEDAAAIAAQQRMVTQQQLNQAAIEQLQALRDQQEVAAAVTGIQQIQAQEQATFNALIRQGVDAEIAMATAAQQTANAKAAANADADRLIKSLQQQGELIRATSDEERNRIAARQTYQNLVDKGVDSVKAEQAATQQLANAEEERRKAEQKASDQAIANIRTRQDAWDAYARGIISWSVAMDEATKRTNAIAAAAEDAAWWANRMAESFFNVANAAVIAENAFVPFSIRAASDPVTGLSGGLQQGKQGTTQFNPDGYKFTSPAGRLVEPQTAIETANALLAGGGSAYDAFGNLLSSSLMKTGDVAPGKLAGALELDTEKLQVLDQLRSLMPTEQQIQSIQQEWMALSSLPASVERDTQLKSLTDALAQLTDATKSNTAAITDVLSPLYSSDPRMTHLGYRAFAGGGIMTPWGELPINQYAGGGIANSPQVAVFGEGRTPEAYVPVPSGRIPVEMRQPANSNDKKEPQRPVNLTVNINAPMSRDDAKQTAFQIEQAARRALRAG